MIEVIDSGTGMSNEVKARCMEMFYSTKGEKGTGLGLGMVSEMVRKHRGRVEIETEEGKGSTFRLFLPLAVSVRQDEEDECVGVDRCLNVLVVDDDDKVREIVEQFLIQDGHLVSQANNGRDGLVTFLSDQFDLVITDHAMPQINGQQLAQSIRKKNWNGPIIMMTGFGDQMRDEGTQSEDINVVLGKPVQLLALRKTMAQLCNEKKE